MRKFNLKEIEEQQITFAFLKPIKKEILSLVSYINYFLTPYEEIDEEELYGALALYTSNNEIFKPSDSDEFNTKKTLSLLSFREFVKSSKVGEEIFITSDESISSKIGFYISLCRKAPIDSQYTRGSVENFPYVYLPFSDGSYYVSAFNAAGMGFNYKKGAVETIGKTMIFSTGTWPLRYIYEKKYTNRYYQYSVFNYSDKIYIKDTNNCLWDSPRKTAFAELYYEDGDEWEVFAADTKYEILEVKLLDANSILYNITSEDLLPENITLEVY